MNPVDPEWLGSSLHTWTAGVVIALWGMSYSRAPGGFCRP
jgi:hypothetical protein